MMVKIYINENDSIFTKYYMQWCEVKPNTYSYLYADSMKGIFYAHRHRHFEFVELSCYKLLHEFNSIAEAKSYLMEKYPEEFI